MTLIQWMVNEPILAGIACFLIFALCRGILQWYVKGTCFRWIPFGLAVICALLDLLLLLGVFGTASEGLADTHIVLAALLAVPVLSMFAGVLAGWGLAVIGKRHAAK